MIKIIHNIKDFFLYFLIIIANIIFLLFGILSVAFSVAGASIDYLVGFFRKFMSETESKEIFRIEGTYLNTSWSIIVKFPFKVKKEVQDL